MKYLEFGSAKDMVCWLMDNEGVSLSDLYNRTWIYENYEFHFTDIGQHFPESGLKCLHLYDTEIYETQTNHHK